ncbi:YidC/Oxa1 family membrane protein insertase [Lipingzhangella halophila]|uniref:Membrane protein insertase YidC n=1 Tax=Lipingzhangella halophila TaxID=1783352 RepID=A0A7W7RLJ0_9ACTN|nr:YidC/Oxa1 family membrane protein insertase [Lipingzhangella halophila]MBB4934210.1 YidC/Oxa1 family membrane protein insertase [Lipingzhangella halophila]
MYSFPPIAAAIGAAFTVVMTLTDVFSPVLGGTAAAAAIVVLTIIVRMALLPLSVAQVRGEKARMRLQPKMRELQRKHAKNRERLAREQQRLFADEGVSPLAGCLPMLAQTPVFITLYGLFISATIAGAPNALLTHTLGGVSLGATLTETLSAGLGADALVFVALLTLVAGTAWASRRFLTLPALAGSSGDAPAVPGAKLMSFLPYGTVAVASFVPLAAGVYLATTTAWTVAERLALRQLVTG